MRKPKDLLLGISVAGAVATNAVVVAAGILLVRTPARHNKINLAKINLKKINLKKIKPTHCAV
jgi:hypothetical protein